MIWSIAGDYLKLYKNGTQIGSTQTGLDGWAASAGVANIGADYGDANLFDGALAHIAFWTKPLSEANITTLATV